ALGIFRKFSWLVGLPMKGGDRVEELAAVADLSGARGLEGLGGEAGEDGRGDRRCEEHPGVMIKPAGSGPSHDIHALTSCFLRIIVARGLTPGGHRRRAQVLRSCQRRRRK